MINKYIFVNLKSSLLFNDVYNYLNVINDEFFISNLVIFPSNIYIPYFLENKYDVGIQNISNNIDKNFTGEITVLQAKSMGIKYVIIGHSDRNFLESDEIINQKIKLALENDFKVIVCIGETQEKRQMLKTYDVLYRQIKNRLRGIDKKYFSNMFIAYEPVLSIGTNILLSNEEIKDTIELIRNIFYKNYDYIPYMLYGGSVNIENIKQLNKISNIDGFLIGTAAYDPKNLVKIIKKIDE